MESDAGDPFDACVLASDVLPEFACAHEIHESWHDGVDWVDTSSSKCWLPVKLITQGLNSYDNLLLLVSSSNSHAANAHGTFPSIVSAAELPALAGC